MNKIFLRNNLAFGCLLFTILLLSLWIINENWQKNITRGSSSSYRYNRIATENDNNSSQEFKSVINFKNIKLPYRIEIPRREQCPRGTKTLILMMSRRNAFQTRDTIRKTWGKDAFANTIVRFLIADPDPANKKSQNIEEQNTLEKEQTENNDLIIIGGFVDSYLHIHLKWYAGLEWQQHFCSRVDWIVKVDDDAIVHLPRLDYWIEHKFRKELAKNPAAFFGKVWWTMEPIRDKKSKWYVSEQDFPGKVFPAYMSGPTYLASRQAISAIMPHTNKTIGFNMDDILYTGILAELGNVSVLHAEPHFTFFLPAILEGKEKLECENGFPKTITVFGMGADKMRSAYELLWSEKCPKEEVKH